MRMHRAVVVLVLLSASVLPVNAQTGPQWITINQDLSSQRFVDLNQIGHHNVRSLTQICELDLNSPTWFSSGLLMVDGVIYVNTVAATYAMNAATCELVWAKPVGLGPWVPTVSNRGSAYAGGMIFRGTGDGRVIALDAKTGDLKWQTQAADPTRAEAFSSAPVVWKDKLFIGIVTADLGVRGRLQAFDTATGKELWRFNTIPVGIDKHANTWPTPAEGGTYPAGGAFWTSFSVDDKTGEVFGPASNPNPDYVRVTDGAWNLYTNSLIALNPASGALNWYCQTISGDTHDWDLGTQPTLYQTKNGRNMLAIAGKEGYVFGIDRDSATGADGVKCQKTVVFKTPGTRVPEKPEPPVNQSLRLVCPGTMGGAEWNGVAYHPQLGILYSGMVDFCTYYSSSYYGADKGFWEPANGQTIRADFSKPPRGWITAMDGETGKVLWKHHTEAQVLAGLVPTSGGLLFGGDVKGNLHAFDAKHGKLLHTIDAGGALNHGLISYAVNGKQYVAAAVGGLTLNPAGVAGALRVVVYGLPDIKQTAGHKRRAPSRTHVKPVIHAASDAPPATGSAPSETAGAALYGAVCLACHGAKAVGAYYPSLLRHTELASEKNNFQVLKDFLKGVPPPMAVIYPGMLNDQEVEDIGLYLKKILSSSTTNPQLANSAPPGYIYNDHPRSTTGTPQWQTIYKVLTSPRCMNCHTVTNYPRQRDIRYPHVYSVVRGMDDRGAPIARCHHCHQHHNDDKTGIPGAKDWQLAPITMAWESKPGIAMTGPELCGSLTNRLLNGDRGLEELLAHLDTHLVKWAWHPGIRWNKEPRTPPPVPYDQFIQAFTEWKDEGGPCPTDSPPSSGTP